LDEGEEVDMSRASKILIMVPFFCCFAAGADSQPPSLEIPGPSSAAHGVEKQEKNAQAFLFVLEFGLGSPFTAAQERTILDELLAGWKTRTETELQKFDAYPQIVGMIMTMKAKDLDVLRKELEASVREWLDGSPAGDPAVMALRAQLEQKGKIVIPGDPPLTEMVVSAYSEMVAFARLLREDPEASWDDVERGSVAGLRREILSAWREFGAEDRKNLNAAPALWITWRKAFLYGTCEERDRVRKDLLRLAAAPEEQGDRLSSGGSSISQEMVKQRAYSYLLGQMKQTTFNTFMWSQGFKGWTPMGKT
jgi:hypothetical protein